MNKSILVLLLVALVAFVSAKNKVDECYGIKDAKTCYNSFDEVSDCIWCLAKVCILFSILPIPTISHLIHF